jgi:hypothetical protein
VPSIKETNGKLTLRKPWVAHKPILTNILMYGKITFVKIVIKPDFRPKVYFCSMRFSNNEG